MLAALKPRSRGFTLIEVMVGIAVVGVLLTLAAPSFFDFLLVQRLKAVNAELVTNLQLARSEAASRGQNVRLQFATPAEGATMSCYSAYIDTSPNPIGKCDCTLPPGARCPEATTTEVRTVQIPLSTGVTLSLPTGQQNSFAFIASNGSMRIGLVDTAGRVPPFQITAAIQHGRQLRTEVDRSGRPTVCTPGGSVSGITAC